MSKKRPTRGSEWRKQRREGYLIPLTSGNVARLRPVALDVLLKQGRIPDFLTSAVSELLFEGNPKSKDMAQYTSDMLELMNVICIAAFVEPRIVEDPQGEDEIGIDDLHLKDKAQVMSLVTEPANVLRAFSETQMRSLDALSDGDGDEPAPEQPAAD